MSHHKKHHDARDAADDLLVARNLAPPSSDMNVTPLIDVLLVLLVIFIATLPLTQRGFDIQLPLETKAVSSPADNNQVVIERAGDGLVTLNKQAVSVQDLADQLRAIFANRTDKTVFVIGAETLTYGDVVPLIDIATALELRIGIITPGMQQNAQRGK